MESSVGITPLKLLEYKALQARGHAPSERSTRQARHAVRQRRPSMRIRIAQASPAATHAVTLASHITAKGDGAPLPACAVAPSSQ